MNNGFPPIAQYSPTLAFESIIHDLYLCAGQGGRAVDTGPGGTRSWEVTRVSIYARGVKGDGDTRGEKGREGSERGSGRGGCEKEKVHTHEARLRR